MSPSITLQKEAAILKDQYMRSHWKKIIHEKSYGIFAKFMFPVTKIPVAEK